MQQTEQFFKYMQMVENDKLYATKDQKYVVHRSPEGGLDTVGYGHKLNVLEKGINTIYGWDIDSLTADHCDYILALDLDTFARNLSQKVPVWDKRDLRTKEMLVEFEFNLGNVEQAFPKFYRAVLEKDIETQRKEYKRYYRDSLGHNHELRRRNRLFYARYLSPVAVSAWG